jgi:hypothetical protein
LERSQNPILFITKLINLKKMDYFVKEFLGLQNVGFALVEIIE